MDEEDNRDDDKEEEEGEDGVVDGILCWVKLWDRFMVLILMVSNAIQRFMASLLPGIFLSYSCVLLLM